MTATINPSNHDHRAGEPPSEPASPRPPHLLPPPVPGESNLRGHRRPSFMTGVALGALVGASVSGGIFVIADRTDSTQQPDTAPAISAPHNTIASLVAEARPSVVAIHNSVTQTDIFGNVAEGQAAGTGFVLSSDGYIVTNNHVVDGASDITVDFADGSVAEAEIVAADPHGDLAVLKVDRTDLTPLPLGSSSALQVGDQLVAIGNALDLSGEPTVTTGIVSATKRSLTEPNGIKLVNLIQTDTAINPGNSGGPLLNMSGEVIGINTAIAGQAQNVGFAIAIDPAKAMIDSLRNGAVPEHALLGVNTRSREEGRGAEIIDVSADSAANTAGLRSGDVIIEVADQFIDGPDELATVIAEHQPGDRLSVVYERDGEAHSLTVTLGARPTED